MKNYAVFIASFVVFLFAFQILSGLLLTLTYVPDTSQHFSGSTVSIFGSENFNYTLLSAIISATLSFIISKKVSILKNNN
ncbi:hypothetical protein COE67_16840 [Priestia megaterium]|uniref:hypothetical protein n=1 Tax=Priestia megaterium TaxID=1404 RepID=UPI000BFC02F4|nr:hypothetical protein [Priestia megaterium]MDP9580310.1 quinol-cytochrome oxidoreductase complex cytochrome b subunit [Bacillus sp. 1751]PGX40294.1 hypothetical protein COE67_16840 [Priestia megaterium]